MPQSQADYQIRFIEPEDREKIHMLLAASAAQYGTPPVPLEQVEQMLGMVLPQLSEQSSLLLTPDGEAAAFLLLIPQGMETVLQVQVEAGVHPDYAKMTTAMLKMTTWTDRNLERFAKSEGVEAIQLRASFDDKQEELITFFTHWGFKAFITQIRMQRDLTRPIPEVNFPATMRVRPYHPEDSEAMRAVLNAAFADHWLGEQTEEAWRRRFIDTEQFRADQTMLVWNGDLLVGFYLSEQLRDFPERGWLEVMAVSPDYQRRGLGTSLLVHALQTYKRAGLTSVGLDVDAESASNALVLYEKVAFEKVKGTRYMMKATELR